VVLPEQVEQGDVHDKQVRSMGTVPLGQLAATTQVLFKIREKK